MPRTPVVVCALAGAISFTNSITAAHGSTWEAIETLLVLDLEVHDAGNFRVLVTNHGQLGSRPGSSSMGSGEPSFEWPRGSGVEYLWTAGVWIGALKNGEPRVTTTGYSIEVRPGPSAIDRIYITREGALRGARLPSPSADDDGDGLFDEDRLNGRDDDLDGEIDEDFSAISDQMFFCEYNDTDPAIGAANPEHVPLEIQVEQSTFAWSDPRIRDLLGLRYTIRNGGFELLDTIYVGLFADCDIGPRGSLNLSEDDRAGFWEGDVQAELGADTRTVRVSVGYMFDANGDAGMSPGYIGLVFLGANDSNGPLPLELANFRLFSGRQDYPAGGDPTNDTERYEVLNGTAPGSLLPPDPMTGLHPPVTVIRDDDYRIVVAAGPIAALDPGDRVEASFAIVAGPGLNGLIANAARAVLLYQNDWRPEGPVAVHVQDFEAVSHEGVVRLSWRLANAHESSAVHVQRATGEAGPWEDRAVLAPAPRMQFEDREVLSGDAWYRLVLEGTDGTLQPQRAIAVQVVPAPHERVALAPPIERGDGTLELRYALAQSGPHELAIFDVRGGRVASIAAGDAAAGSHVRLWDPVATGVQLVRGVYFVRLTSSGASVSRKLLRLERAGPAAFRP